MKNCVGEEAVGDRLPHERSLALRRVPDGDRADDEDRRGGAARPEAQRRPQEHRKHDVGHVLLRRHLGQHHEHSEHDRHLDEVPPPEVLQARRGPRQDGGRQNEDAGRVAKRPGAKDPREFVGGDHVAEVQRHRPEGGADDGGEERAHDETQHVEHAIELAPPAGQAAQHQGRDHERQRVPHRLAEDGPQRRRVIPEPEVADDNPRPEPSAIQKQHGKSESRRRPQSRHRTVEIGKLEADPSRQVIAHRNQRNGNSVKHDTAVPGPAQRRKPSVHAVVVLVSPRSKRCRHALPRAESNRAGPATATNLAEKHPALSRAPTSGRVKGSRSSAPPLASASPQHRTPKDSTPYERDRPSRPPI